MYYIFSHSVCLVLFVFFFPLRLSRGFDFQRGDLIVDSFGQGHGRSSPGAVFGGGVFSSIGVALVVVTRLRDHRLVYSIVCCSWLVLSTSESPLPHAVFGLRQAGGEGFTFVGTALKR